MIIAIDIRSLQRWDNRFRGIGFYLYNLIEHLLRERGEHRFCLLVEDKVMDPDVGRWLDHLRDIAGDGLTLHAVPPGLNPLNPRHQWQLNTQLRRCGADLLHAPVQGSLPWLRTCRAVVTVHDLVQLRFPEMYLKGIGMRSRFRMLARMRGTATAQRLIAISECTRRDMMEFLGIPAGKIDLIYNGVGEEFRPLKDNSLLPGLRARWNIPEQYLFYVGGVEARKNITRLLEAFQLIRRENPSLSLVLAGKLDEEGQAITAQARAAGHLEGVILPGFVSHEELISLYNGCVFVVFPSLYEGFGFPAAEAMACGKTLLTSNVSSLIEVVGNAAVCVDPLNVEAMAQGMRTLLLDPGLRTDLENKARLQVQRFNWQTNARQVMETYTKAVRG